MTWLTKKFGVLALLLITTLLTKNAAATLVSSYYEGSTYYNTADGLFGRIDFAVYDTEHPVYADEYKDVMNITKPGEGQFIYAYQIFSSFFYGDNAVAHFAILDQAGSPIDESFINGTMGQDDGAGGRAPTPVFSETQGVWKWTFDGGYIYKGEHSWLLVFSSNHNWAKGSFEIKGPTENDLPVPAPEAGTLALLSVGAVRILLRRRRI